MDVLRPERKDTEPSPVLYALKAPQHPLTNKKYERMPEPGDFSGNPLGNVKLGKDPSTVEIKSVYKERLESDANALGYYFAEVSSANHVPKEGNWLIALTYKSNNYWRHFHFYLKGEDGFWSHKPGDMPVEYADNNYKKIRDPATCSDDYYGEVWYFEIGPNKGDVA